MGSGKTTVGKILAQKLSRQFLETDEIIEKRENLKIKDIFCQKGEAYFRALEKETVKEVSLASNLVVSCGGGLACNWDNLKILKKSGSIFCLSAPPEEILKRVKGSRSRPLLNVDNPLPEIVKLMQKRKEYYDSCGFKINTGGLTPDQVASRVLKELSYG